jgi:hypothetical protein
MAVTCRVFGSNNVEPEPAALLWFLAGLRGDIEGHFQGDDQGWFRLHLRRDNDTMQIERFLVTEEGIRAELNSWAAWVESTGDDSVQEELMRQIVSTQQIMLLRDFPEEIADTVCCYLARVTDGIYQMDDRGFLDAHGTIVLADEADRNLGR